jgi:Fe-S-cluster containining protein
VTISGVVTSGRALLKFRCTGCGNCCKDPLLPLTDADVARIISRTNERAADIVRFVNRHQIDMDDEPEAFVRLRQGKRVMVLAHHHGGCHYLGADNRCKIYGFRPLGCRVFPFDPRFTETGALRRLKLIQATDCKYELDGQNYVSNIRELQYRHDDAVNAYHDKIAEWNKRQLARRRAGQAAETVRAYLDYLGLGPSRRRSGATAATAAG